MSAFQIPLIARPSQTVTVQLGTLNSRIKVYQKRTGLYLDLHVNNRAVVLGVLCRDRVYLLRGIDPTFQGDLCFVDTQGLDDPVYSGLADRFQLLWNL
ncbi:MAG: hypothetical protein KGM49_00645 [Sphingomonadales bacterium]|nr:hypothetical protein [Sphingomonadales bacterium]